MLGLVDYDSDDGSDTNGNAEESMPGKLPKPKQPSQPSNQPALSTGRKKVKRVLGISALLPPEIRQLLESGGREEDEEDGWSASKSAVAARASKSTNKPSNQSEHQLFGLLPPPQSDQITQPTLPAQSHTAPVGIKDNDMKKLASNTDTSLEEDTASASESGSGSESDNVDGDSKEKTNDSFFSFGARQEPRGVPSNGDVSRPGALEPEISSSQHWQEVKDASGDSYYWNPSSGETTWEKPASFVPTTPNAPSTSTINRAKLPQESFEQQQQQQFEQQQQQQQQQSQLSGKERRMNTRDLERALASGDLGALGHGQAVQIQQPDTTAWNPHRHGVDQFKQQEVKIAALTYDPKTGESQTVYKPSKVQKRKHQINSLAYAAAERELELMEKKGQSLKTKSQTQAKYGW